MEMRCTWTLRTRSDLRASVSVLVTVSESVLGLVSVLECGSVLGERVALSVSG